MPTTTFAGVIPPILTPYTANGDLDVLSLERLLVSLIDGGVGGLFVLGSSGEVAFLDDQQRRTIVETAVRVADGQVPVLVGVNDMTANRVLVQVRIAAGAGAQAVVATAPFYAMPGSDEVEQHFRMIAAASAIPVFAYDVPVRVHRKLDIDMLVRLGLEGVLCGVKDSSGDDVAFRRLVAANRAAGAPLRLFTGHEVVVDGALLAGADGVVPGLGNVDPRGYVRMMAAAEAGDWSRVRHEQERLAELFEIVFQDPGAVGEAAGLGAFKTALMLQGTIETNLMSPPIPAAGEQTIGRIRDVLQRVGMVAG